MIKVIRDVDTTRGLFERPVITIGNFDGVHLGHQALLQEVISQAKSSNVYSVVFTFDPHPVQVLAPSKALPLLQTISQKVRVFGDLGLDGVILYPFNKKFSGLTAREFASVLLVDILGVSAVIVGTKFRFGAGREGDVGLLKDFGRKMGFDVISFPEVKFGGEIISSSKVRQSILDGAMDRAVGYLGRIYSVQGKVIDGIKLGKKLGYPTANVKDFNQLLPRNGVYAVECLWRGNVYKGAASVGVRPTIDTGIDVPRREKVLEVHLLDFNKNIYSEEVEIFFHRLLRPEYRFNGVGDLVRQMAVDVQHCREYFHEREKKNRRGENQRTVPHGRSG
jgi:riboflavin kinase/FMN adenylyltransferase